MHCNKVWQTLALTIIAKSAPISMFKYSLQVSGAWFGSWMEGQFSSFNIDSFPLMVQKWPKRPHGRINSSARHTFAVFMVTFNLQFVDCRSKSEQRKAGSNAEAQSSRTCHSSPPDCPISKRDQYTGGTACYSTWTAEHWSNLSRTQWWWRLWKNHDVDDVKISKQPAAGPLVNDGIHIPSSKLIGDNFECPCRVWHQSVISKNPIK